MRESQGEIIAQIVESFSIIFFNFFQTKNDYSSVIYAKKLNNKIEYCSTFARLLGGFQASVIPPKSMQKVEYSRQCTRLFLIPPHTLPCRSVWSPFSGPEVAEMESSLQALRYGGEMRLSELVGNVSTQIDRKLLQLMMKEFYLSDHLLALKKFVLLGQGDFVTCLMDEIGPELKKRASQLFRHNLSGMLEGALRASNAQFEPSYVLDRIGVRLLEPSPGDTGEFTRFSEVFAKCWIT